ncbi:DUF2786 domain-containing protein [Bifidobacterium adolescentis]|uniref:DUF2786 domain-containing protein n=1 Tax=Bifidobacterium adolescentis TaxID=1680 RepID=UPI001E48D3B6|nr:DUF2786 domain-containing protein [Bifidobacterium adolescentis]MDB0585368.1 DUF2786 domain-containing protein [Bifidobacterium adolescentis]MDB0587246.1 DUF2786 domain-containing protein [Bifidobacterium adolescentis]MDB0617447.1 DUF2786 domain-containing protein [Bifidobacterium adolescentis]MDB0621008.1 DUF2786 domain-containing protein [Bifidobacterium adolescentis]MDB0622309.1 DUF2786 domain-containing protein [Bifidobacterium adolescentis]
MGNVERVMERVHRLLAIANDPAASDNEQHIALEQAQRLMNKHAIEEWQLEEDHDDVEIIERRIRFGTDSRTPRGHAPHIPDGVPSDRRRASAARRLEPHAHGSVAS